MILERIWEAVETGLWDKGTRVRCDLDTSERGEKPTVKSPSPVIQGSTSYAILGLNLREGFLGHACQAAQKLLCPVEMFVEGQGAGGNQGLGEGRAQSYRSNGTWSLL